MSKGVKPKSSPQYNGDAVVAIPFVEGGGDDIKDVSKQNLTATILNFPYWGDSDYGNCIENNITKTGSHGVTIADGYNAIKGLKKWSVSITLVANSLTNYPVLVHALDSSAAFNFFIELNNTNDKVYVGVGNSYRLYNSLNPVITLGQEHTLTFVKTGSGDNGDLYIDGFLQTSWTLSLSDLDNSNSDLSLMYYRANGYNLNGQVIDFRLWDYAISEKQVHVLQSDLFAEYRTEEDYIFNVSGGGLLNNPGMDGINGRYLNNAMAGGMAA